MSDSKKPRNSVYTPLSETEQDAVSRMVEGQDLMVEVEGWGYHPNPTVTSGDKRIQVKFPMVFDKPEGIEVPVRYFDLKLKLRNGKVLVKSRESTYFNGKPLRITAGIQINLTWDLMIDEIPKEARGLVLPDVKGKKVASDGTSKDAESSSED